MSNKTGAKKRSLRDLNDGLNIITWNINGKPLYEVVQILSSQLVLESTEQNKCIVPHVVFLQETHCVEIPVWIENEWHAFYTQYNTFNKGVAILVNKSKFPSFRLHSQEVDSNGRYVVVRCELDSQEYTLVSVYNHQSDTRTLDLLIPYLQNTAGTLVIGGDFNTTLEKHDRAKTEELSDSESGGSSPVESTSTSQLQPYTQPNYQHGKIRICVKRLMRSLQLVDVFRGKNGYDLWDETCFTYRQNQNAIVTVWSRLDYFFIPEDRMWSVIKCEVLRRSNTEYQAERLVRPATQRARENRTSPFMDHSPLLLQLENKQTELPEFQAMQLNEPEQNQNINRVEIVAAILELRNISGRPQIPFSPQEIEILKHDLNSLLHNNTLPGNFSSAQEYQYLVLSTILAWRLQDWGSEEIDRDQKVEVTDNQVDWENLKGLIQIYMGQHPCTDDFNIIEKMLSSGTPGRIRLNSGCPLSRTLRKLFTR